jgi:hypothetical protein
MFRHLTRAFALSILVGLANSAFAGPVLVADLSNEAENPDATPLLTSTGDPRPTSFGVAEFLLNDALTEMTFTATVTNIDFTGTQTPNDTNDDLTVAHIHAGPDVTATTNAGVVWGFFGQPFNETNPNDQLVTPFATGVGGTISGKWDLPEGNNTTLDQQLDNILNGRAYINFHTTQFGGGEVRGTLRVQAQVIPLPPAALTGFATLALLGIKPLHTALRRRKRSS